MRNFQDTYETRKRSFVNAFTICITVPLMKNFFPVALTLNLTFLIYNDLEHFMLALYVILNLHITCSQIIL